jgi:alternate signal-mediated exported protein
MRGIDMNKSTKGALAAGAAASLLLGGAGSLAYWTDSDTVDGSDIASGHLKLVQSPTDCDAKWQLNGSDLKSTDVLSPEDTLTRHCAYTVSMDGTNLTATLAVVGGDLGGGDPELEGDLDVVGAFTYDNDITDAVDPDAVVNNTTTLNNGGVVDVLVTVSFKDKTVVNNASNTGVNLTSALNDLTVTATQS